MASENVLTGTIYLIPVPIGETPPEFVIPSSVLEKARTLDCFLVENAKSARAFLKSIKTIKPLQHITVIQLEKHESNIKLIREAFENHIAVGNDIGLMSESGMPGIADPGAEAIGLAHSKGYQVMPMVGPSSIFLALAASGLNGQDFHFHGYLPKEKTERKSLLKELENQSRKTGVTHIFIETPYRNDALFSDLLAHLSGETKLCVGRDITGASQLIRTLRVDNWRKTDRLELNDKPTVFLIG